MGLTVGVMLGVTDPAQYAKYARVKEATGVQVPESAEPEYDGTPLQEGFVKYAKDTSVPKHDS
jgi:hypothetical protein